MKITCEVIKDLMPLCYEDIASDESKLAVSEHCKKCESCAQAYDRMSEGEIKIEDDGSGLKQFLKNCKENSDAVLALCCYLILVISGIVDGIMICNMDPTAVMGVIIFYAWLLFPIAGGCASAVIARHKLGLKYIFPVICGLVVIFYPSIILNYFTMEIGEILNFMWGFVPAVIGFVVGMIRGEKIGVVNKSRVNGGMVASAIVIIAAVIIMAGRPPVILSCAGVVVFVTSFILRMKEIKSNKK